jgi:hypothetical protein
MAKLTRAIQKIFCGDVPPNNVVAVFGSLKNGTPTFTDDVAAIQALPAYGAGWAGATVLNQAPALQDMNALQYLFSRQIAYVMQAGVAEWSASETYYTNSVVQSGGKLYISTVDDNLNQAFTTTSWKTLYSKQITAVSGNYTVLKDDYVVKATGGSLFTISLPAATANNVGEEHTIKSNMNAGVMLNVAALSGSLIDGLATIQLSRMDSLRVICDGTQWMVV